MSAKAKLEGGHSGPQNGGRTFLSAGKRQASLSRESGSPSYSGDDQSAQRNYGKNGGASGWQIRTLGEIARIERGKFSHRPRNEPRFYGGNTPFVQTGDVTRSNGIIRTYTQTLNADGVAISKVFPVGTILITIAANIGYTGILRFDSAAPDSLAGVTPIGAVCAEFLNFYLRTQQPEMDRVAPKGTQKNINIEFLKPWPVVVPPLPEQKRIAHILSTVQRAIEAQERIIQTTTELKMALMHKLFTEGLRGERQKQTEIGPVPESWDVVRCEDVCDTISVGIVVKPSSYYAKEGVPAFRSQNVREDRIQAEPMVYITKEANNGPVRKSKLCAGDVLIVRTGYPGTSCVVPPEFNGSNCIDLIFVRPNKDKLRSHYLSRFFNSDAAKIQVQAGKVGLAQQHFNVGAVKNTQMPLPPTNQQDEIVSHLELLDAKHDLATSKRNVLQDLFRTLLHELMTAKTRVHNMGVTT